MYFISPFKLKQILQSVGVDFAQVSAKSEKFYGREGILSSRGEIKYTKAVNVFGLVTKS